MKILVAGIVNNPQVKRLKKEAEKRGHALDSCYVSDLVILCREGKYEPNIKDKSLTEYDLIYLWTLGARRWVWYAACEHLSKYGVRIVNSAVVDPEFNFNINVAKEYLLNTQHDIPYPQSMVILSSKSVGSVKQNFDFPLILKTGEGRQGKSVYKINDNDELTQRIKELEKDKLTYVVREFIPNGGDIRVFTVGYKAIGAMRRIPKEGDFKSNISQGGRGEKFDLEKYSDIKILAEKAAEVNRVEIAGVDIITHAKTGKHYVLEVNPGPQFLGLEKYTGINASRKIIEYFEKLAV